MYGGNTLPEVLVVSFCTVASLGSNWSVWVHVQIQKPAGNIFGAKPIASQIWPKIFSVLNLSLLKSGQEYFRCYSIRGGLLFTSGGYFFRSLCRAASNLICSHRRTERPERRQKLGNFSQAGMRISHSHADTKVTSSCRCLAEPVSLSHLSIFSCSPASSLQLGTGSARRTLWGLKRRPLSMPPV